MIETTTRTGGRPADVSRYARVLRLDAQGLSNQDLARRLGLDVSTSCRLRQRARRWAALTARRRAAAPTTTPE